MNKDYIPLLFVGFISGNEAKHRVPDKYGRSTSHCEMAAEH